MAASDPNIVETDPPDYTDQYNTPLAPADEVRFQAWGQQQAAQREGRNPAADTFDYDMRGFWKSGGAFSDRGHAGDTFKKPNHPTFSTLSQYNGAGGMTGGQWVQRGTGWDYIPSATNLNMHGPSGLRDYFAHEEPDSALMMAEPRASGGATNDVDPAADLTPVYEDAGKQYGIDPDLLRAQTHVESSDNDYAVSSAGAQGRSQFIPSTARRMGLQDPFDPRESIPAQARLLRENMDRFGSPEMSIAAYHGGENTSAWGDKTRDYLNKVVNEYGRRKAAAPPPPPSAPAFDPSQPFHVEQEAPPPAFDPSKPFKVEEGRPLSNREAVKQLPMAQRDEPAESAARKPFVLPSQSGQTDQAAPSLGPLHSKPDAGTDAFMRIYGAAGEGYKDTPPILTEKAQAFADKWGLGGDARALGSILAGMNAAFKGAQQTAYEIGSGLGGPALGRDLAGMGEAFPLGGHELGVHFMPRTPEGEIPNVTVRPERPAAEAATPTPETPAPAPAAPVEAPVAHPTMEQSALAELDPETHAAASAGHQTLAQIAKEEGVELAPMPKAVERESPPEPAAEAGIPAEEAPNPAVGNHPQEAAEPEPAPVTEAQTPAPGASEEPPVAEPPAPVQAEAEPAPAFDPSQPFEVEPAREEPPQPPQETRAGENQTRAVGNQTRQGASTPFDTVPKEPERLSSFLRRIGGVKDEGGDIRSSLGGSRFRPGLINNKSGIGMDEAALKAWEAGYFPEVGDERPSINDLRDALDDDVKGRARYSHQDEGAVEAYSTATERNAELDRLATEHGIATKGKTHEQFYDELHDKLSADEVAREMQSQADAHEAAYREAEQAAKQWVAYHGTPHDFEQFDAGKIGTGEGAQSYGHGLYFAENEGVARTYRQINAPTGQGAAASRLAHQAAAEATKAGLTGDAARSYALNWLHEQSKAVQADSPPHYYDAMNNFDALMGGQGAHGNLLQVRLHAKPEEMLDWDKPLAEQPPKVVKALIDAGALSPDVPRFIELRRKMQEIASRPASEHAKHHPEWQKEWDRLASESQKLKVARGEEKLTGEGLYLSLAGKHQGEYPGATKGYMPPEGFSAHALASQALHEAGIKGIRYLDQGSRAGGEGTHNVVMFDPRDIEITHRNGEPVKPEAWHAKDFYGNSQARTLKDLEDEHQQETAATAARERGASGEEPGTARGDQEPVPEGGGTRGGGAGAGRGAEAADHPGVDLLGREVAEARAARTPEPTIRNDARQETLGGTEPSAVQAQAARDAQGRGALQTDVAQKPADEGLFAPDTSGQGTLYSGGVFDPAAWRRMFSPLPPRQGPPRLMPLRSAVMGVVDGTREVAQSIANGLAPMHGGTTRSRGFAADFANALRRVQYRFGEIDRELEREFKPAEREQMGRALDAQSVFEQQVRDLPADQRDAARADFDRGGTGLSSLNPAQRNAIDALDAISRGTWKRMQERGMVSENAEPLPYYFPRQMVNWTEETGFTRAGRPGSGGAGRGIDARGQNLTTAGPMRREHLTPEESEAAAQAKLGAGTQLLRDIRSLPQRLAFAQRAIAGVDLMNKIEQVGRDTGVDLVVHGDIPGLLQPGDFFTMADHPSFRRFTGTGWQAVHVAKEFEGPLKAVLTQASPTWYRAAQMLKGGVMTSIMYSPFIHLAVELGRSLPVMPGKILTLRALRDGSTLRRDLNYMDQATRDGLAPLGRDAFRTDPVSIADQANVEGSRYAFIRALGNMRDAVANGAKAIGGQFLHDVVQHPHQTLLWDNVFNLQVGIYNEMRQRWIAKGFDPEVAGTMAAHIANRYAGALPPEHLSRAANMAANLALFSRSFTLGNLGVMKDMLTGAPQHIMARIEQMAGPDVAQSAQSALRRKAIAAFTMDVGLFYVANGLLQAGLQTLRQAPDVGLPAAAQQTYDDWLDKAGSALAGAKDNPLSIFGVLPQHWNEPGKQDRVFAGNDSTGRAVYLRLPPGKVGEEFIGWFGKPGTMIENKLSPLVRPIIESIFGKDTLGRDLYKPNPQTLGDHLAIAGAIVKHFAEGIVPTSTIQGVKEMVQQHVLGQPTQADPFVSAMKVVGPLTGLAQISQGFPGGPAAGEMHAQGERERYDLQKALPGIRDKIRNGDTEGAVADMTELRVPPGLQRYYLRQTLQPGPTKGALRRLPNAPADVQERVRRQMGAEQP